MEDTLYRCTVCGRVGTVGRCCGDETREPLNDLARREQEKIKAQNLPKADAYTVLGDVRELLDAIDSEYNRIPEGWGEDYMTRFVFELKEKADKVRANFL